MHIRSQCTLSPQKCEFSKTKVTFIDHAINIDGIRADPEKNKAILDMGLPTSVSELRRFLGMANKVEKFTLNHKAFTQTAVKIKELDLGHSQSKAFDQGKE